MYLNDLMAKRHMTREELYRLSGVPDSTLRGILSGGAQLENCKAGTLYGIAKALHIPMEALLEGASYGLPEDDACTGFCYAGSDCTNTCFRYQFYGNSGIGICTFQVVNQLCQILNRVNIMMRRRRNEGYTRC